MGRKAVIREQFWSPMLRMVSDSEPVNGLRPGTRSGNAPR